MTSDSVSPRWIASGWTVFNNKGQPVRQYEPHFTDRHSFEFSLRVGKSPVFFYDPVGRRVATLNTDRTWNKVVLSPWRKASWDVSDTVLVAPETDADVGGFFERLSVDEYTPTWHAFRTSPTHAVAFRARYPDSDLRAKEQAAARQSEIYARTPSVVHGDSLGRTILAIAHNRFRHGNAAPTEQFHTTRNVFDVQGHERETHDARGRIVALHTFDMLGNRIHYASMEAGKRWMLSDAGGKPQYVWDSRGHRFRSAYDALQRPTDAFLLEGAAPEMLISRSIYGESRPTPQDNNLRGKLVEFFDQAGVVKSDRFDFKGNPLSHTRQVADTVHVNGQPEPAYKNRIDWNAPVSMASERYVSQTRFDALNRPVQLVAPHSDATGANIHCIQPSFSDSNQLERIDVWLDHGSEPGALIDPAAVAPSPVGVAGIDYDAKGQRERIDYKNDVSTRYTYDFETFRLVGLDTQGARSGRLQNLRYTFDVAGNITHIHDSAQQTIFFANARVEPSAQYTYDALFRLIEATGREHLGQVGGAPIPHSHSDGPRAGRVGIPHANDGQALGRYIERYVYDQVGNILSMQHRGTDRQQSGWTRRYAYNEPSQLEPGTVNNRLTSTTVGNGASLTATYSHDEHGNMLTMPHLQMMQWNEHDHLQMTQRQAVNQDGVPRPVERTWYVYDASGERVRKVTELANGQVKDERLYLGGFEIYRKPGDNLVRETLHITDGTQRLAMVETRIRGTEPGIPRALIRYQLGNHLGSACLELDDQARVLSYEEYTPYGSTSYQAVRRQVQVPKRYRFTGMERDEESGLSYHSARYYAPWLGRWTRVDPEDLVQRPETGRFLSEDPFRGDVNDPFSTQGFTYAHANPMRFVDLDGMRAANSDEAALIQRIGGLIGRLSAIQGDEGADTALRNAAFRARDGARRFRQQFEHAIDAADEGEAVRLVRRGDCSLANGRTQGLTIGRGGIAPSVVLDECTRARTDSEQGRADSVESFMSSKGVRAAKLAVALFAPEFALARLAGR